MKYAGEELPTGFVGRSLKIVRIRGQLEKPGPSRTPVLIQGESGTGKEVAARSLFNASPRGQFVPIDCGSLVGPLMEIELFGHARHSFTGAGEAKRGLMELANGGTVWSGSTEWLENGRRDAGSLEVYALSVQRAAICGNSLMPRRSEAVLPARGSRQALI
jgi:sigma54-dependent transcription regulator